jgi:hypothetical protein
VEEAEALGAAALLGRGRRTGVDEGDGEFVVERHLAAAVDAVDAGAAVGVVAGASYTSSALTASVTKCKKIIRTFKNINIVLYQVSQYRDVHNEKILLFVSLSSTAAAIADEAEDDDQKHDGHNDQDDQDEVGGQPFFGVGRAAEEDVAAGHASARVAAGEARLALSSAQIVDAGVNDEGAVADPLRRRLLVRIRVQSQLKQQL